MITPEYSIINLLAGLKPNEVYALAEDVENSMYLSKLADLASRVDVLILTHIIEKPKNHVAIAFLFSLNLVESIRGYIGKFTYLTPTTIGNPTDSLNYSEYMRREGYMAY